MNLEKYLIYLDVPAHVEQSSHNVRALAQEHLQNQTLPDLHCTLYYLQTRAHESTLRKHVERAELCSAECITGDLDIFSPAVLVCRLHHTESLISLHRQVYDTLSEFQHDVSNDEYFGDNYNPHISIGNLKQFHPLDIGIALAPHRWQARELVLAKKVNKNWTEIQRYRLAD